MSSSRSPSLGIGRPSATTSRPQNGDPTNKWVMIGLVIVCAVLAVINIDLLLSWLKLRRMRSGDLRVSQSARGSQADAVVSARAARVGRLVVMSVRAPSQEETQVLNAALAEGCKSVAAHHVLPASCTPESCPKEFEAATLGTVDADSGAKLTGLCLGAGVRGRYMLQMQVARDASSERLLADLMMVGGGLMMVVASALFAPALEGVTAESFVVRLTPMPVRAVTFSQLMAYETASLDGIREGGAVIVMWWRGDVGDFQ